jgi:hypothetical protein
MKLGLSASLQGQHVGIQPLDLLHVRVWYRDLDLSTLDILPAVSDSAYLSALNHKKKNQA